MALKGYHSYRGRQGSWRWLLTLVLVVILVAACLFLFLQRFVTYSDDGSYHLDLPVFDRLGIGNDEQSTNEPEQDVNLVIEEPEEPETEPEQEPEEQEPEEQEPVHTEIPYSPRRLIGFASLPADEAEMLAALETVGADGFVFTAKADKGAVCYTSAVALPQSVMENAASEELVSRLCAMEGIYTVAKVNCFHDSDYAFANMEAAGICQKNGYIWYDYQSNHWLDPEKEAARAYVIDLALECAQMGFDELLLEDMCYPHRGKLYKIDYSQNTMAKADALALFLGELRRELEPYGVRISLLLEEDELLGTAENTDATGMIAQQLLPLVDSVYAVTEDPVLTEEAMKTLLGGEDVPILIPIVADETATGGWYLPQ